MTSPAPPDGTAADALPPAVVRFGYGIGVTGVLAAAVIAWLFRAAPPASLLDVAFGFATVALTAAIGIDFSLRDTNRSITMDEIGYGVVLILLPPPEALLAIMAGAVVEQAVRRRALVKTAFNVGQTGLSMGPAVALVAWIDAPALGALAVAVVIGALAINGLVNIGLFVIIVSRQSGEPPLGLLRAELGTHVVTTVAGGAIGIVAAQLWRSNPLLLPLLLAPALLARTNTATRREAAAALAAERDRLSRAIEGITDGVALVDPTGHVVVCNDSFVRISGGLGTGEDVTTVLAGLRSVPTDPELASDPRVTRFEGDVHGRTVRLVRHVTYEGGRVTGEVVQLQDVTHQRELEQLREDFVSRVSHELRTPLTAINGTIDTLLARGDALGIDQRVLLLDSAKRNGRRLQRLVSSLLMRARIEGPVLEVSTSRLDLAPVVASMLEELDAPGTEMRIPPDLHVEVDADHLLQMLENLITNAVRYGAPPIEVTAEAAPGGRVLVRVADHGPGIPRDFRDRMFHPFTQASTGTRRQAHGLGLGLDIVRSLAVANGGAVRYEPGTRGASFVIDLPAASPAPIDRRAAEARG